MQFNPLTEEEASSANLIPPGDYPFQVLEAEDRVSKNGNDMIALTLAVWPDPSSDRSRKVWDFLVCVDSFMFKIRHFAYAVGIGDKYESGGYTASDCEGLQGYVTIKHEKDRDSGEMRERVADYVTNDARATQPRAGDTAAKVEAVFNGGPHQAVDDEDIPF